MRILAIDTTANFGSVALHQSGVTLEEMPLHAPEGFGQILFGHLEALLRRHDWKLSDIDVFAAAAGPGSFTGVRIGLAAVKGLAEANGRGALAVSNLRALAAFGVTGVRGAVMDARRGEIYGAVYNANLELIGQEVVAPFPFWLAQVPTAPQEIISTDFSAFRSVLSLDIPVIEQRALAAAIARIAEQTPAVDPGLLDANYVRRSDAELLWADK